MLRPVWTGRGVDSAGTISGDGRYLPFADPDSGDLFVRDLSTNTDVRLTNSAKDRIGKDFVSDSAMSRDGTKVAYSWYIDGWENQLRVTSRVPDGPSSARTSLANADIAYIAPFDWSPRGDWIAVQVKRVDGTAQIGLVDASTGTLRTLRSVDWRGTTRMSVSHDGAWILYDLPAAEGSRDREVLIISTDGRRQHKIETRPGYNAVVGWSPDGGSILYAAERSGAVGIWTVSVSDGKPHSPPRLLEPDLGAFYAALGMSSSGRLTFAKKVSGINVYRGSVDFVAGTLLESPQHVTDSMVPNHPGAMWSPDGTHMAYVSSRRGVNTIVIQSLDSGRTRELTPRVSQFLFPRWSAKNFMTFQGVDLKGRQGIFRMDIETAETTLVVGGRGAGYLSWAAATPDEANIVYTRNQANKFTLISRHLATGEERELFHGSATATATSPDGTLVAFRTGDRTSSSIVVVPVRGGDPRVIMKAELPSALSHFVEWLPDGRVLVGRNKDRKFDRLVAIALDGRAPVQLPPSLNPLGSFFRVHPDGRQIVYSAGDREFELWTIDNFLAPVGRNQRAGKPPADTIRTQP